MMMVLRPRTRTRDRVLRLFGLGATCKKVCSEREAGFNLTRTQYFTLMRILR